METLSLRFHSRLLFSLLMLAAPVLQSHSINVGINYGQIADNLPTPPQVATLLESITISRVKLYDANPTVLTAFANTSIELTITVANSDLPNIASSPSNALSWIQTNVQPFLPQTKITSINVGNEILSSNDNTLIPNLLPAMQALQQALTTLNLTDQVNISTAHSLAILAGSYPPSSATFRQDLAQFIQPILTFHSQTNSPFLINSYPYFAYKASPTTISLPYVLFEPNSGVIDPTTNLTYDNMLYAQIDAVYAAMKAMGCSDVAVRVSETGWPSKGDADEVGATPQNAALYNGNLMQRMAMNQGTPMNPSTPIDVYVFALFNEDMKPGPTSERNYGLFYPDGTPVYNVGLQGYQRSSSLLPDSSASELRVWSCSPPGSRRFRRHGHRPAGQVTSSKEIKGALPRSGTYGSGRNASGSQARRRACGMSSLGGHRPIHVIFEIHCYQILSGFWSKSRSYPLN